MKIQNNVYKIKEYLFYAEKQTDMLSIWLIWVYPSLSPFNGFDTRFHSTYVCFSV